MYQRCSVVHCATFLQRFFFLLHSINLSGFLTEWAQKVDHSIFLTKLLPVWPTFKSLNISGFIAYLLYMLHVKLPKGRWKLQPQNPATRNRTLKSVRLCRFCGKRDIQFWKTNCVSLCGLCRSRTLRHYIPLRQRAGHLCVHKVGLELAFALDVDDASARAHVAQSLKDATRLLCHL